MNYFLSFVRIFLINQFDCILWKDSFFRWLDFFWYNAIFHDSKSLNKYLRNAQLQMLNWIIVTVTKCISMLAYYHISYISYIKYCSREITLWNKFHSVICVLIWFSFLFTLQLQKYVLLLIAQKYIYKNTSFS